MICSFNSVRDMKHGVGSFSFDVKMYPLNAYSTTLKFSHETAGFTIYSFMHLSTLII